MTGHGRRPDLLVTGATGYLGRRVVADAARRGARVVAASRSGGDVPGADALALDLGDEGAVGRALRRLEPVAVIHAAAANPGAPPAAFELVNAAGTGAVAAAVAQLGTCRLVHVSTDVVLDGRAAPYDDGAAPNPLSAYGRSKAAAEAAVAASSPEAAIVRTSLVYDLDEPDRGTAGFARVLAGGARPTLFADVWRQPVWAPALAAALVDLALEQPDVAGHLNVAGAEAVSRAAFARALLEHFRVPGRERVVEGSAAPLADVPLDLRLRLRRAEALAFELPGVSEVLGRAG